jgi:hypothetical protein
MSTSADSTPFDPRPLTEPVDRAAAKGFVRQLRAAGSLPGNITSNTAVLVFASVFAVFFLFILGAILLATIGVIASMGAQGILSMLPFIVIALLMGGAIALVIVLYVRATGSMSVRIYRLDRFARANGMSYLPRMPRPPLPGMIFGIGSSRVSSDIVRGKVPRFVEFANYSYETGSGKERNTFRWGYVALKLDTPLPNIVLDATSNNGLLGTSNLPVSFDKDQRLHLEGDFDQHFALYCPSGYERDALYLFTPDIMARFIDNAAALDVEIVDDWLFLYAKRDFSTLDPATWAWLFSLVGALLDKFAQWSRWRDERLEEATATAAAGPAHTAQPVVAESVEPAASPLPFAPPAGLLTPPPGVAQQGRRLRQKVPWQAFVVIGLVIVVWVLIQTGVLGQLFGQ